MLKLSFTFFIIITLSSANLFTITDKQGNVLHEKAMEHCENECLTQKSTEYSYQAIYDELHRAENLAYRASSLQKRVQQIAKATARAKKAGKTYHLTAEDKKKLLDYAKFFKGGEICLGWYLSQRL